jgi:adenosylmethionine-8-amino-7-oxononanoate transaminase
MSSDAPRDRQYVWHPFTQMREWGSAEPLVIQRGEGCHLFDSDGRRFLDATSSQFTVLHGHNHRELNLAIIAQLQKVAHSSLYGLANAPAARLAQTLVESSPAGLERVFYSHDAASAVEAALHLSAQFWANQGKPQKNRFVCLEHASHGTTAATAALAGPGPGHRLGRFENLTIPSPAHIPQSSRTPEEAKKSTLEALASALAESGAQVAALVVEPLVQVRGGMLVHPEGFLSEAVDLCRQHDVHLIVDETVVGLGRTGHLYACQAEKVEPDFLCLAGGLGAGYLPIAATLTTTEVFEGFLGGRADNKAFAFGDAYGGNPLACAVALASLELIDQGDLLARAQEAAAYLSQCLRVQLTELDNVGDIRQVGLLAGVEVVAERQGMRRYPHSAAVGEQVCSAMRKSQVLAACFGDVVVTALPLTVGRSEIDHLVDALRSAIRETCW